jgi:hypothetical protein
LRSRDRVCERTRALDYIDDLGYYGLGAAATGLATDAVTSVLNRAAQEAQRDAPLAGARAGGTMLERRAAAATAARAASRIGVGRAILVGLSRFSGVLGAAATGFSAGARLYCLQCCAGEDP